MSLELRNGGTSVSIDLEHGGAITSMRLADGYDPIAPRFDIASVTGEPFAVRGWQTMFPNAGSASSVAHVEHPAHGAAFREPWDVVDSGMSGATILFRSAQTPLTITRSIRLGTTGRSVVVADVIANPTATKMAFLYGHHVTLMVSPRARVRVHRRGLPAMRVEAMGADESEAFRSLTADGTAEMVDPGLGRSVRLTWTSNVMAKLWLWQVRAVNLAAGQAFGIEPVSTLGVEGLAAAEAAGEALWLAGEGKIGAGISLKITNFAPATPAVLTDPGPRDTLESND